MARRGISQQHDSRPPKLAERLLKMCMGANADDWLLGDLAEEYSYREAMSPVAAKRWYWRQTLLSLLPILGATLHQNRRVLFPLAITLCLGLILTTAWDAWVAQTAAWRLAGVMNVTDIALTRIIYVLTQAIGFFITARIILIAYVRHLRAGSAMSVPTQTLIILILCLPILAAFTQSLGTDMQLFRLGQIAALAIVTLMGVSGRVINFRVPNM